MVFSFDTISHAWLIRFIEHRIGDRRIVRLIRKWLAAGVLEEGRKIETVEGTPQGAVISPLLANVYLHYVYDLWVRQWRQRQSTGDMIVVRYADDTIVGFERQDDAKRFLEDLSARMADFELGLHPEKTRLIEFGRKAIATRRTQRLGKPETFRLPWAHALLRDPTKRPRLRAGKDASSQADAGEAEQIQEQLKATRHYGVEAQGKWLAQALRGWSADAPCR